MSDMAIQPAYIQHFIDIDEYHRMAAAGVFAPDARIELIDGELIERVGPIHPPHAARLRKSQIALRSFLRNSLMYEINSR